jgi:hypothetical protein
MEVRWREGRGRGRKRDRVVRWVMVHVLRRDVLHVGVHVMDRGRVVGWYMRGHGHILVHVWRAGGHGRVVVYIRVRISVIIRWIHHLRSTIHFISAIG